MGYLQNYFNFQGEAGYKIVVYYTNENQGETDIETERERGRRSVGA